MNVHYKRDLNSNYMILTDEHREDGYEVRMITENRIYGFLHACVRNMSSGRNITMRLQDGRACSWPMSGKDKL